MIDWKKRSRELCEVGLLIDGQRVVARPVSARIMARIQEVHPEPGVPTDEAGKPMPQHPRYLGLLERHRDERTVLEAAAVLDYRHADEKLGEISIRAVPDYDRALAWVRGALEVFGASMTTIECRSVVNMVDARAYGIGAAAKNSSSSSPDRMGSGGTGPTVTEEPRTLSAEPSSTAS